MQDALFPDEIAAPAAVKPPKPPKVGAQVPDDALQALAEAMPASLHLGTSSWTYPGWGGLVWDKAKPYSEHMLSKYGLTAYSRHPLLRAVSIDRSFYRALTVSDYQRYAAQVPADFRFTVKCPSMVTDALVRGEDGRGQQPNAAFLDPELAVQEFVAPALEGLGERLGALVFQLSPLPPVLKDRMPEVLRQLEALLQALPSLREQAPEGVVAVEVRDPEFLTPAFVEILRAAGATYCLGLHPKLPPIEAQLPLLRALWPGPLVCRWNLHAIHGPYGYEEALKRYGDYDQLIDLDPETHAVLANVIRGTTAAGHKAYVTISNQAEGCAPLTVRRLAEQIHS